MTDNIKLIPYKEINKKKSCEYYHTNKEVIAEKNKIRYSMLTPEQKKKRVESNKRWYNNLSPEKKEDIKQKRREYNYNRYHNVKIAVSE